MNNTSELIIYNTEDGLTKIDVNFDGDTVWLSIDQMAELFQRDRSVIGKHVRNIFKEGELTKESVWANMPTLHQTEKLKTSNNVTTVGIMSKAILLTSTKWF